MNRADATPGLTFVDWGIHALLNTVPVRLGSEQAPGWPPKAIDPSKPFKWQTRRLMKDQPPEGARVWNVNGQWCLRRCSPWRDIAPPPYRIGQLYYAKEALVKVDLKGTPFYATCYEARKNPDRRDLVFHGKARPRPMLPWTWEGDRLKEWYMPAEAARLFYVLHGIGAAQVAGISDVDAQAEGVGPAESYPHQHRDSFAAVWCGIHGPPAWERNDYVWVYQMQRVEL